MVAGANRVATIPEFSGDAAVAGIFDHARFFAASDLPADFGGELEMVAAVVNGPGAIGVHQYGVVGIGDEVVVLPGAGIEADVGHADDGEAIPGFCAHGAVRVRFTDGRGGLAIAEVAGEKAVGDDGGALRGDAFIVVGESAEARAVSEAGIGNDIDDLGAVFQVAKFLDGEKTHSSEIGFLAEDAVEFDGMPDGLVNLEAELGGTKDYGAGAFGALRGGMQRDGFFRDSRRVADE